MITTHANHPPLATHGLADDCGRCSVLADQPFDNLDDENLRDLIERVRNWEPTCAPDFRSRAEQKAMARVQRSLQISGRLERLSPAAPAPTITPPYDRVRRERLREDWLMACSELNAARGSGDSAAHEAALLPLQEAVVGAFKAYVNEDLLFVAEDFFVDAMVLGHPALGSPWEEHNGLKPWCPYCQMGVEAKTMAAVASR